MAHISPPPLGHQFLPKIWADWVYRLWTETKKVTIYTQSLNVASVASAATSEQTFTVTGLTTADTVIVNKPSHNSGLGLVNARVSAADTLALTFMNVSGGAIDPGAETYTIIAIRS